MHGARTLSPLLSFERQGALWLGWGRYKFCWKYRRLSPPRPQQDLGSTSTSSCSGSKWLENWPSCRPRHSVQPSTCLLSSSSSSHHPSSLKSTWTKNSVWAHWKGNGQRFLLRGCPGTWSQPLEFWKITYTTLNPNLQESTRKGQVRIANLEEKLPLENRCFSRLSLDDMRSYSATLRTGDFNVPFPFEKEGMVKLITNINDGNLLIPFVAVLHTPHTPALDKGTNFGWEKQGVENFCSQHILGWNSHPYPPNLEV